MTVVQQGHPEQFRRLVAEAIWSTVNDGEDWVPWEEMPEHSLPHEHLLIEADAVLDAFAEAGVKLISG